MTTRHRLGTAGRDQRASACLRSGWAIWALCALLLCGCRAERTAPREPPPKPPPPPPTVTLAAVGDMMLARGVGSRIGRLGVEYPFKNVAQDLSASDITFGNLECPLSEKGKQAAKAYSFKAAPGAAQCLVLAGFDVVSLANNHILDCGRTGLLETLERLQLKGISWCGAGRTAEQALAARVIQVKGVKFAFVGFSQFADGGVSSTAKPTVAGASEEAVRASVAEARKAADLVVASFHWGEEYAERPSENQRRLAKVAAEAGADLVLGHHAHVLQGFEVIRDPSRPRPTLVAYSLGNFVFDSRRPKTLESVILRCRFSGRTLVAASLEPIAIVGWRPELARGEKGTAILRGLEKQSAALGTTFVLNQADPAQADILVDQRD